MKIDKKSGFMRFDLSDVRRWEAWHDSVKHVPYDWEGTAIDFLNLKEVSLSHRLWVVLRTDLINETTMRYFAVSDASMEIRISELIQRIEADARMASSALKFRQELFVGHLLSMLPENSTGEGPDAA